MSGINYLANINKHERDNHITFDEGPHIYTIDGDSDYLSVTTWNHSHFKEFNADRIIDRMMNSKNWINSEYYGMSKEEIKNKWNKNAIEDDNKFLAEQDKLEPGEASESQANQ